MGYTQEELAGLVGYSTRRLRGINKELPESERFFLPDPEGGYNLSLFIKGWVDYNVKKVSRDDDDLEVVKAKHEIIKTQKTELEVARMRGSLVDVQDVKRLWGGIANNIMQNLIHMPHKIAPTITMMESAEEIAAIIEDEVNKILTELSETPLPDYANDGEEGEDA